MNEKHQIADEAIRIFLDSIEAASSTKFRYQRVLQRYVRWSEGKLPEDMRQAQAFILFCQNDSGHEGSTLAVEAAALRRYLLWKGISGARLEHKTSVRADPQYLSLNLVKALLDSCDLPIMKCLTALLYDTGARVSEVLGVHLAQVDWEGYITVTRKGGKQERVPVSNWGMGYLQEWTDFRKHQAHSKLFGDWSYNEVYREYRRIARRAGIPHFSPHMLRHSRAVHLRQENPPVDWSIIAYLLGHKKVAMTIDIYGRLTPQDLRKVIPAPRLG